MNELLEFKTDDGTAVLVEVDSNEPGFEKVSRGGDAVAKAKRSFEEALVDVRAAAERALAVFTEGPLNPDGLEIEFGVRLNAEAGAVIAKTAVEGHLSVKLIWNPGGRPGSTAGTATRR
ncbi:CU044_2847 family protein [Nocardia brasiliensis]|uniref:CU044_2847 family protein n=1 Tax=Nocardia brasiliensis TaxID=37326 RepID=UPI0024585952|nr:CU044_2847 family protein [Nocardia brasiliensis]